MSPRPTIIYGGTFDPPHVAHVLAIAWLVSALDADVWVEPVHTHVLGKQPTPFATRVHWMQLACAPFGPRVTVREDEARPGASGATIDLITHLQATHPERAFRLAVGSDVLAERHRWRNFDGLLARVPLIVLPRPGYPVDPTVPASVAPITLPDVSSTALRHDLAAGVDVHGRVPAAVIDAWGIDA